MFAYVTEDPERDWPDVAKHHAYQMDTYLQGFADGTDQPAPPPVDPAKFRERGLAGGLFGLGYGTPETIAAQITERYADLNPQHVLIWVSLAGMPEAMVMQHIAALSRLQILLAESPA